MAFQSHIGVLPREKETSQLLIVDVVVYCRRLAACTTDQLTDTVDYSQVFEMVRLVTENARYDLIEKLAGVLADNLLQSFLLADAVDVTVNKPDAPIVGQFESMGVQIYRERT
jgi:dihydroneopterin aldolase